MVRGSIRALGLIAVTAAAMTLSIVCTVKQIGDRSPKTGPLRGGENQGRTLRLFG